MTKPQLEAALKEMMRRPPKPEAINTSDKTKAFMHWVAAVKKAKTADALQSVYNQLRPYYDR